MLLIADTRHAVEAVRSPLRETPSQAKHTCRRSIEKIVLWLFGAIVVNAMSARRLACADVTCG